MQESNNYFEDDSEAELLGQETDAVTKAVESIAFTLEPGKGYRRNAPELITAEPDIRYRTRAITTLLSDGVLVELPATATMPPYLMLAE